jgi:predicted secreted protein
LCAACSRTPIDKKYPEINELLSGSKYKITLPEDHHTGYLWHLDNGYNTTLIDYYGSVWRGNEKGIDFNFNTLEPGQDTLTFYLIKHRDTSNSQQFIVKIKAK